MAGKIIAREGKKLIYKLTFIKDVYKKYCFWIIKFL